MKKTKKKKNKKTKGKIGKNKNSIKSKQKSLKKYKKKSKKKKLSKKLKKYLKKNLKKNKKRILPKKSKKLLKKKFRLKKKQLPIDRIKKIKIYKIKFKKLKLSKIKIKKKKLYKIKNKAKEIVKFNFQKFINFILTPVFTAYDSYSEKKRIKKLQKIDFEKKEKERLKKQEERSRYQLKEQELKDEIKIAKERSKDLKNFLKKEQALIRLEQKAKEKKFLEEIRLEKKLENFRKRELQEIKNIEKISLKEQRDDYKSLQERLEKIKDKYRLLREQKVRERVKALGLEISDDETKEDLLNREKEFALQRQQIELVLESFYRSASSLIFQLNKKYIPKHKSLLRVIDHRWENNECFIRYDDASDEEWLILFYLKNSDPKEGKIVVENKSNPEKHETVDFKIKQIFKFSDYLVDSMTNHIDKERKKKLNNK